MTSLAVLSKHMPQECLADLAGEDFERLEKIVVAAKAGGWAKKTLAAFFSDGQIFATWCVRNGHHWLPATPETVAAFVTAMAKEGRAAASIDRMMWAITKWHRHAGKLNPVAHELVDKERSAYQPAPEGGGTLIKGLGEADVGKSEALCVPPSSADKLIDLRDYALLLVAHDTQARPGELVAILRTDVNRNADGSATILMRRPKKGQTARGKLKWISPKTVAAIDAWLAAEQAALLERRGGEMSRVAALRAKRFGKTKPQGRKRLHDPVEPVRFAWPDTPYLFRGLSPVYEYDKIQRPDGSVGRGDLRRATGWSDSLSPNSVTLIFRNRRASRGAVAQRTMASQSEAGEGPEQAEASLRAR